MQSSNKFLAIFFLAVFGALGATAQVKGDSVVPETDLPSLLFKKDKAIIDSSLRNKPNKKIELAVLPILGYNPANGFVAGAAISGSTMLGDPANTRQSSGLINATVTTKDQLILIGRAGLSFPENKYLLDLEARVLFFTQDTYGLGTRTGKEGEPDYASPEPMTFNFLRLFANGFRRVSDYLYVGVGLSVESHSKIVDRLLNVDSVPYNYTAHYTYSTQNEFPLEKYSANGVLLSLRWDSRDNIANPYTGWYASASMQGNTKLLGSTKPGAMFSFDGRYYVNVQRKRPSHLVAFWLRGNFCSVSDIPYLALPSTSWDTYNRTGRGYIQGRFRGPQMVYFETEYRYPITRNGLLGGVVFTNFTTTSGNGQNLFNEVAPAAGFGVRVKLDKKSRANITIDYGVGKGGSNGIFFNLQEAF